MIKKSLMWLFGLIISVPLLVLFVPVIYMLLFMLLVCLPPALVLVSIFETREEYKTRSLKDALEKLFIIFILLPFGLITVAAPLRSVLNATESFFPTLFAPYREFHQPLYDLLVPLFGELSVYWLDFYWGIYGVIVIIAAALMDSIRRNTLVQQIDILPTSTVQGSAIGLVELKGKVRHIDKPAVKNTAPIMRRWIETSDDGNSLRTESHAFYLDDGTGSVLVDPLDCHVGAEDSHFGVKLHQAVLKTEDRKSGFAESRIMPGDECYVLGNLQIIHGDEYKENVPEAEVVIKPQKSSLLRPNFYDLFFVSNTSEEELLAVFRKSIYRGWWSVFIALAITAWLSVYAWNNIVQIQSLDLDASPALISQISSPTVLEREFSLEGLGKQSNLQMLTLLQEGHAESDAILSTLQEQNLDMLVLPILLKQAKDIDHLNFGIANAWLGKLKAVPRGHWAAMYWGSEYEESKETLVLRVILDLRDGSLFASYRAKFDRKKPSKFELKRRYVLFEFTNKETGIVKTRKLAAKEGWNAVDDVEVFEYFLAGEYTFDMYPGREYRGGPITKGSRKRKPFDVKLY